MEVGSALTKSNEESKEGDEKSAWRNGHPSCMVWLLEKKKYHDRYVRKKRPLKKEILLLVFFPDLANTGWKMTTSRNAYIFALIVHVKNTNMFLDFLPLHVPPTWPLIPTSLESHTRYPSDTTSIEDSQNMNEFSEITPFPHRHTQAHSSTFQRTETERSSKCINRKCTS